MTEKTRTKAILEWVYCGVIAIVIVLLIKSFIGIPTVVKQSSMYPTLKQNERLWLSKLDGFSNKVPERGDIITFEAHTDRNVDINHVNYENPVATYEYNPNNLIVKFVYYTLEIGKTSYIKRVIGLPGEHVEIKNGSVYINGEKLQEDYLQEFVVTESLEGLYTSIVVPENTIYVLGDNRGDSVDSRRFGCIPLDKIEGKAVFRFWPLNKMGTNLVSK